MSTHPIPMVPAGFDLLDECTQLGRHGEPCLERLDNGDNHPNDLCTACRRTLHELVDSVLPAGDPHA